MIFHFLRLCIALLVLQRYSSVRKLSLYVNKKVYVKDIYTMYLCRYILFRKAYFFIPKFIWILEITSKILENDIVCGV